MNTITTYTWPGQTRFGFGAAGQAGRLAKGYQAKRAFILADPGVIAAGLIEPVQHSLEKAGISAVVYDRVTPNPDIEAANAAGVAFRESEAEVIIGVGGGSALDMAKAVRLLAGGPAEASIAEYALLLKKGERRPYPQPHQMPLMIAIPTTAGTGSEVTSFAVITDHERKFKMGIGGAFLIPNAALIDPELSLTLPPGPDGRDGHGRLDPLHRVLCVHQPYPGPGSLTVAGHRDDRQKFAGRGRARKRSAGPL